MHINWSKLDNALSSIYHSYLEYQENPTDKRMYLDPVFKQNKEKLFISVLYHKSKDTIVEVGFVILSIQGENLLHGFVYYKDLPALTHLEEVKELIYGSEGSPSLINSVVNIKAKKSGSATGVWEMTGVSSDIMTPSTPAITGNGGASVLIGIIDSGIDYNHENFKELTGNNSRILRIWDQGLQVRSGENSPAATDMLSGLRYGVEYKNTIINTELLKEPERRRAIRHKDKTGHGTHVAGIAAGNGREYANLITENYVYSGVAPLAKIVVVKYLGLDNDTGNPDVRFKDAVHYINKIGDDEGLPVVINCSFGVLDGPHDGYSDSITGKQEYLNTLYTNLVGKACVFAVGNNYGSTYYSKITIPPAGTVEIDFTLTDTRVRKRNTKSLEFSIYYASSVTNLEASLKVPGVSAYSAVSRLNTADISRLYNTNKRYRLSHQTKSTQDRNGVALVRNKLMISIIPYNERHKSGSYKLKLVGSAGTELHLWRFPIEPLYGLIPQQPSTPAGCIEFSEDSTFNSPTDAENIISVGSYDPSNDDMSHFSSHGKLVSYTSTPPSYDKPEIAAPGTAIMSTKSSQVTQSPTVNDDTSPDGIRRFVDELFNLNYTSKQGTSMAAPHVTGVIALMLSKNRGLNSKEIKDLLMNNATANVLDAHPTSLGRKTVTIEAGAGKLDALTTINITPTP